MNVLGIYDFKVSFNPLKSGLYCNLVKAVRKNVNGSFNPLKSGLYCNKSS